MIKVLQLSFTSLLATIIFVSGLFAQSILNKQFPADLVGHWNFNNSNDLTEAIVGVPLILVGSHIVVEGPSDTSGAARIGVGSHYISQHGISSNGGGSKVNNYTIVMDIKIPSLGKWYAFYQTQTANTADGDWFLNPNGSMGVGQTGYTPNTLKPNEWYRIAISVSNGSRHDYYFDGQKVLTGSAGPVDGRFSLESDVLFFADENSEDNTLDVADIKIFSRDLSDERVLMN